MDDFGWFWCRWWSCTRLWTPSNHELLAAYPGWALQGVCGLADVSSLCATHYQHLSTHCNASWCHWGILLLCHEGRTSTWNLWRLLGGRWKISCTQYRASWLALLALLALDDLLWLIVTYCDLLHQDVEALLRMHRSRFLVEQSDAGCTTCSVCVAVSRAFLRTFRHSLGAWNFSVLQLTMCLENCLEFRIASWHHGTVSLHLQTFLSPPSLSLSIYTRRRWHGTLRPI